MPFDPVVLLAFLILSGALAIRDAMATRVIACVAAVVGVAAGFSAGSELRLDVLVGLVSVMAGAGFRLRQELHYRSEVALSAEDRLAMRRAFPGMHSRDWTILVAAATPIEHKRGDVLMEAGGQSSEVCVLLRGSIEERHISGRGEYKGPGAMWGELSYCAGQMFNGSPTTLRVSSDEATVLRWDYATLAKAIGNRPRMRAAVLEGFVRAGGMRHGLVQVDVPEAMLQARLSKVRLDGQVGKVLERVAQRA